MFLRILIVCSIIYLASGNDCPHLLRELGDSQSKVIYCITAHSAPVTMCNNCYEKYINLLQSYDRLAANCSSDYFNKDRINLVASTESVLTGLWAKAFCDDCFNNNNSDVFYEKNTTLKDCTATSEGDPCENCKYHYLDLNNFYINLEQHNNGEVCYDLQDQMNRTRNWWSKELKCCARERNMTLFAIALSLTSCLPLLFYATTFLITKRQERYHSVLHDEDPMLNSEEPSSSRRHNINDINNPIHSMLNNGPSSSNAVTNNDSATTPLKAAHTKGFDLTNDVESSDDEEPINFAIDYKEK